MTLPSRWTYAKIDLFNNATAEELILDKNRFKVALNVKLSGDEGWQRFWAQFNSPKRHVWRGIQDYRHEPHYVKVRQIMAAMDTEYRVSKFYDEDRVTQIGLTGLLIPADIDYQFVLVYESQIMQFELSTRGLTPAQRAGNMIASGVLKTSGVVKGQRRASDRLG